MAQETYGLGVDPWSAVEAVPFLCAVSLNSSCEESSEPKRMSKRNTQENAAVWEFKKCCSDENESHGECSTSNARQELSVNHGDAVVNEVMNANVVMKELMNASHYSP